MSICSRSLIFRFCPDRSENTTLGESDLMRERAFFSEDVTLRPRTLLSKPSRLCLCRRRAGCWSGSHSATRCTSSSKILFLEVHLRELAKARRSRCRAAHQSRLDQNRPGQRTSRCRPAPYCLRMCWGSGDSLRLRISLFSSVFVYRVVKHEYVECM